MNTLEHKGYGRIFVEKEDDIQKVKDEIKDMDEFEYSYLPENLISVFPKDNILRMKYTHKFSDLNMDHLSVRLFKLGIRFLIINNGQGEYFKSESDD